MEHHSTRIHRPHRSSSPSARRENSDPVLLRSICKSIVITIGIALGLITVAALALSFTPDPNALILPVSLGVCAVTSFMGGFISLRIHGSGALICGLLNGGIVMALMLLLSLLFRSYASAHSTLVSALLHTAFLALSVAGAFAASYTKGPKKQKRR